MTNPPQSHPILTFRLGEHAYGLPIAYVVEVAAMVEWVSIPETVAAILGFINRHEQILPLIDLRTLFNLPPAKPTITTLFVVVQVANTQLGLVVDEILQVEYLAALPVHSPMTGPIISGIVNQHGELIQIISLEPILQLITGFEQRSRPTAEVEGSHES